MGREKHLIEANDFLEEHCAGCQYFKVNGICKKESPLCRSARIVASLPAVDAVKADDMRAFANDVAYQFGYYSQCEGRLHLTHGGLSTLEEAFDILGWDNPHPVPECECEVDGCHEHATCGTSTRDGYKRMCVRHFMEMKGERPW